jgi:2,4-dienoyl-CoA reductase-like NADH-dependent reductase (Old Yellow Enzyme family)
MSLPKLFQPFSVGNLTLANRIVIAPMCQYSAIDGCMTDWHLIHLGHLALSGAALPTIEATAVEPVGRITYADVGLWDETTAAAMARVLVVCAGTPRCRLRFSSRMRVARHAKPKVTDMRIQPMVSSSIDAAMITWPIVRRRNPRSRITSARTLTEEIDSAVPRNSVVTTAVVRQMPETLSRAGTVRSREAAHCQATQPRVSDR